jgi:hypothetical protein
MGFTKSSLTFRVAADFSQPSYGRSLMSATVACPSKILSPCSLSSGCHQKRNKDQSQMQIFLPTKYNHLSQNLQRRKKNYSNNDHTTIFVSNDLQSLYPSSHKLTKIILALLRYVEHTKEMGYEPWTCCFQLGARVTVACTSEPLPGAVAANK